jgi:hypothetical protein
MALPVTVAEFRAAFPAFSDVTKYPDAEINFWINLGNLLVANAYRWGDLQSYGIMLFVAHNLALEAMSTGSGGGGTPGAIVGPLTSGSVDKVSYSRNPGVAMDPKNGHWNLTSYGLRYIQLVRMVGAGPVQVGVPEGGSNYDPGLAWPGVVFPQPVQ